MTRRLLSTALFTILLAGGLWTEVAAQDVMIFTATWCGPCRDMKKALVADPEVLTGFNAGLVDVDESPELQERHDVVQVPTTVVVDEHNREIGRLEGWPGGERYRAWLVEQKRQYDERTKQQPQRQQRQAKQPPRRAVRRKA